MIKANNPDLESWVSVPAETDFPIQNLPFGVFKKEGVTPRVGVAIGNQVLDLKALHSLGFLTNLERDGVLRNPKLKGLLASAHSHMSPFNLLLAATLWPQELQEEAKFRNYCSFFSSELEHFCHEYFIPSKDIFRSMVQGVPDLDGMLHSAFFGENNIPNPLIYGSLLADFQERFE